MFKEDILPQTEEERQYYYIGQLKKELEAFAEEKKRPFCYKVVTLGCQMNAHDSEKLKGILEAAGAVEAAGEEKSDVVVYNTCCVRENAEQRVFGRLGFLKSCKKSNPGMIIALCGCMMQEKHIVEKLKASYPFVDLVFGTFNNYCFAELLCKLLEKRRKSEKGTLIDLWEEHRDIVENLPMKRKNGFKASVNVMYGCNNFCSYCIVPYVRGREVSRKPEDIIREVRELVAGGAVEIELLGQNVNSYGKNLEPRVTFAELLEMVCGVEGVERVRFMSSHPKDLSDELIAEFGKQEKLCPHFHLPLQSGSDRLLEKMNRRYTKEQYLELIRKLREVRPGMAITTDIIVGFPGETREDFLETLDVVEKAHFSGAFTFIYSKREGTPAAKMPQVDPKEAQANFDELLKALERIQTEDNKKYIGKTVKVLAEDVSKNDPSLLTGRAADNALVHFRPRCAGDTLTRGSCAGDTFTRGSCAGLGKMYNVRITESSGFYLTGEEI